MNSEQLHSPSSSAAELYEEDFYAWTQEQAKLLQAGMWGALDIPNLVEEIESLGKQVRRELRNRLKILLGHLLKWEVQTSYRSKSWTATIREQRREILLLLSENPSLKPYLSEAVLIAYENAINLAIRETGLDESSFPIQCAYTVEQILDQTFLPNDPSK